MAIIETLGPILANVLAAQYFSYELGASLGTNLLSSGISGAFDLLTGKLGDARQQRRIKQQFERIAEEIIDAMQPMLDKEAKQLGDDGCEQVLRGVIETLNHTPINAEVMVRTQLDAKKLHRYLLANKRVTEGFSQAQQDVYERILYDVSEKITHIADGLPNYTTQVDYALLASADNLTTITRETLTRLRKIQEDAERNSPDQARQYLERRYRNSVNQREGKLHIFGLEAAQQARSLSLHTAHVPLQASRVLQAPRFKRDGMGDDTDGPRREQKNAEDLICASRRVCISGDAGSGKTTILQWLAVQSTEGKFGLCETAETAPTHEVTDLPFLFRLRHFVGKSLPAKDDWLATIDEHLKGDVPPYWMRDALAAGRVWLMVDGVDEFPKDGFEAVQTWLDGILAHTPQLRVLITSRPNAIKDERWQHWLQTQAFAQIELQPLDEAQIEQLVGNWHTAVRANLKDEAEQHDLSRLQGRLRHALETDNALRNLASTPLLCAMLCVLNHKRQDNPLPTRKDQLYAEACDVLISKRDDNRQVPNPLGLTLEVRKSLLSGLALRMMRNNYAEAPREWVGKQLRDLLRDVMSTGRPPAADKVLTLLIERTALLREPVYGRVDFTHRSFQEYLAAFAAVQDAEYGYLTEQAGNSDRYEVIVMACGIANKGGRDEIIGGLLDRADQSANLAEQYRLRLLAGRGAASGAQLDRTLNQRLNRALKGLYLPIDADESRRWAGLGNNALPYLKPRQQQRPWQRAACIDALAEIGTPQALDLIAAYAEQADPEDYRCARAFGQAWRMFDRQRYKAQVLQKLRSLSFAGWFTDADLAKLAGLSHLQSLDLMNTKVSDAGLHVLASLSHLQSLSLSYTQVSDAGLHALASLSHLQSLYLMKTKVSDAGLHALASLSHLQSLDLSETQVSDAGLHALASLSHLQSLSLRFIQVSDAGLHALASLSHLQSLSLRFIQVSDAGLHALASLSHLQSLSLSGAKVSDAGLHALASLSHLQSLSLRYTQVSDAGLHALASLSHLQSLSLGHTKVSDVDLHALTSLSHLQSLSLMRTKVSDAGLHVLASLSHLQSLSLMHTKVSGAGMHALTSLSQLQLLDLWNTQVSDAGLHALASLSQLQSLSLMNTNVSDADLHALASLSHLQSLNLKETQVSDAGLHALASLSHLQSLELHETNVSDAGIALMHQRGIQT